MSAGEPIRVMVIDDSADSRFLTRVLLEADGMAVVAEADGAGAALAALDGAAADVIVLDARMPRVDGFELAPALRERRPDAPIVLLTSIVDEVVAERAAAAGVSACLDKGDIDALPAAVARLAGRRTT